jgi:hypothetical protein
MMLLLGFTLLAGLAGLAIAAWQISWVGLSVLGFIGISISVSCFLQYVHERTKPHLIVSLVTLLVTAAGFFLPLVCYMALVVIFLGLLSATLNFIFENIHVDCPSYWRHPNE